jgi:hypothetical protein
MQVRSIEQSHSRPIEAAVHDPSKPNRREVGMKASGRDDRARRCEEEVFAVVGVKRAMIWYVAKKDY